MRLIFDNEPVCRPTRIPLEGVNGPQMFLSKFVTDAISVLAIPAASAKLQARKHL